MKTFFESFCPTDSITIDQLKQFIDNEIKNNDYVGLSSKIHNNVHDLGDYQTVNIYINMIEPDWDDTENDEAYQYDMLIDQAKTLSDAITNYLF